MVKSSGPPPSCCGRLSPLLVARADEVFDRRCSLLHCVGPLMAQSGHPAMSAICPLSGQSGHGLRYGVTPPRSITWLLRMERGGALRPVKPRFRASRNDLGQRAAARSSGRPGKAVMSYGGGSLRANVAGSAWIFEAADGFGKHM